MEDSDRLYGVIVLQVSHIINIPSNTGISREELEQDWDYLIDEYEIERSLDFIRD